MDRMDGKLCVVTGANSGIGKAMAEDLAALGARVVMVCRNEAKAAAAREEIVRASGNEQVDVLLCDVAEPASVRAFGERYARAYDRVDVLLNNAGLYLPERAENSEGREMMYAINHLGAFRVTRALMGPLEAAGRARVVTTSSVGHHFAYRDLDDLDCRGRFLPMRQYGSTKLCNILFTRALARRLPKGVVAHCFHPGAVNTNFAQQEPGILNLGMKIGGLVLRTPKQGGDTGVWLASAAGPAERTGEYFSNRRPGWRSSLAKSDALTERLWELSEEAGI